MGRLGIVPAACRAPFVVALGCAAATALLVAWPALHFAYRGREVHVGLETASGLVALVGAFLMLGRLERRRRLDDLLLACALAVFAVTNLAVVAIPSMFSSGAPGPFSTWAAIGGRLLGTVALATAAVSTPRPVRWRHPGRLAALLAVGLIGVVAITVALLEARLPTGVQAELTPERSDRPRLIGHPAVLSVQLVAMGLFALAAIGFARRAARERDEFLSWLAAASVLAAFARFHYFLYPSLYSEWVYSGDLFRLLSYVTILVGGAREVQFYWRAAADAAVLEERRRIARELHDGLAQELAYVARNLHRPDVGGQAVSNARAGTERALAESRRAIAALSDPVNRPLEAVLAEAIEDVAAREHTHVALALDPGIDVTPEQREGLVRIACEATANAARHGGAEVVRVELRDGRPVRLRITDAGRGFDPDAVKGIEGRYGIRSMRERADALGGRFRLSSAPERGTEVEVEL